MDENTIQIRSEFAVPTDEALAYLDKLASGALPINDEAIRALAQNLANTARLGKQLASHIVRLNSVGSFVIK